MTPETIPDSSSLSASCFSSSSSHSDFLCAGRFQIQPQVGPGALEQQDPSVEARPGAPIATGSCRLNPQTCADQTEYLSPFPSNKWGGAGARPPLPRPLVQATIVSHWTKARGTWHSGALMSTLHAAVGTIREGNRIRAPPAQSHSVPPHFACSKS